MSDLGNAVKASQINKGSDGRIRLSNCSGPGLLAIVSDYCGHCHTLKQNVKDAQKIGRLNFYQLSGDGSDTETKRVMKDLKVTGFPDMYHVSHDGSLKPYNGGRDPRTLVVTFGSPQGGAAKSVKDPKKLLFHVALAFVAVLLLLAVFRPKSAALRS